jgi:AraC-like DNA-binding protein
MSVRFAAPSKALTPYIERYWAMENVVAKGKVRVQRIIPSGLAELVLYLKPRPKILTDNKHSSDNVALCGQQNDFYDLELTDNYSVFAIVFKPQGLMRFFNFPLNEIYNRIVSLKDINGQAGRELEEKMNEATAFQQQVSIVEAYLFDLMKNNFDDFTFRRINHIAELIKQTYGTINIHQMASEACLSRKQFERIFAGHIGISPKQYLKIIRFQSAIYQKSQNNQLSMAELSFKRGNFDLSHFINDFKSLCGLTPKQHFAINGVCSYFFCKLVRQT